MKLLFDENLSDRIIGQISDIFPGSSHVKFHDLTRSDDSLIWAFAKEHGFVIISKDADFYQRSLLLGAPPKFVFLRIGNCSTGQITSLLRDNLNVITTFLSDPDSAVLVLT